MAELVKIIHYMPGQTRFTELSRALSAEGREALQTLLSVPVDDKHPIYGILSRARNKAGFHFDPEDFAAAIRRLMERFG